MQTRSKTGAILLAVFLSYWTWCYTYKNDSWKFWLGLALNVTLFWTIVVPIGIAIWAIIDSTMTDSKDEYYWN